MWLILILTVAELSFIHPSLNSLAAVDNYNLLFLRGQSKSHVCKQAKQRIHSLLPIFRQVFSQLQESRAPSCVMVTWEDKLYHSERPPSFFFPQLYMLSMMSYGMEYPFGQLGSAVPAVSPPNFLCTPASSLAGWGEKQKRP